MRAYRELLPHELVYEAALQLRPSPQRARILLVCAQAEQRHQERARAAAERAEIEGIARGRALWEARQPPQGQEDAA